ASLAGPNERLEVFEMPNVIDDHQAASLGKLLAERLRSVLDAHEARPLAGQRCVEAGQLSLNACLLAERCPQHAVVECCDDIVVVAQRSCERRFSESAGTGERDRRSHRISVLTL